MGNVKDKKSSKKQVGGYKPSVHIKKTPEVMKIVDSKDMSTSDKIRSLFELGHIPKSISRLLGIKSYCFTFKVIHSEIKRSLLVLLKENYTLFTEEDNVSINDLNSEAIKIIDNYQKTHSHVNVTELDKVYLARKMYLKFDKDLDRSLSFAGQLNVEGMGEKVLNLVEKLSSK